MSPLSFFHPRTHPGIPNGVRRALLSPLCPPKVFFTRSCFSFYFFRYVFPPPSLPGALACNLGFLFFVSRTKPSLRSSPPFLLSRALTQVPLCPLPSYWFGRMCPFFFLLCTDFLLFFFDQYTPLAAFLLL